jgi:hypothetical protein
MRFGRAQESAFNSRVLLGPGHANGIYGFSKFIGDGYFSDLNSKF